MALNENIVLGAYNSSTGTVSVSFTYENTSYTRLVAGVLDGNGVYSASATTLFVEKLFSGVTNQYDFLALASIVPGGPMANGTWVYLPAIYKLILNGTGLVTIDTITRAGVITTGVVSYNVTGSEIYMYYYFGPQVSSIRATLTGTATAIVA